MLGLSLTQAQAPAWWPANAIYAADFVNRRYMRAGAAISEDAAFSFSRSSSAWAQNAAGQWVEFGTNVPRFTAGGLVLEPQRENLIRNNAMAGAAVGTPGTLPTHWARFRTGSLNEPAVVGTGGRDGVDYVDLRLSGTASGNNDLGVFLESFLTIPSNATYSCSAFFQLISGSLLPATFAQFSSGRYLDGAYVSGSTVVDLRQIGDWSRGAFDDVLPSVGVNQIRPSVALRVPSGLSIDAVIRVGWPQIELGTNASTAVMTSGSTRVRLDDGLVLQLPAPQGTVSLEFDDGSFQTLPGLHSGAFAMPLAVARTSVRKVSVVGAA